MRSVLAGLRQLVIPWGARPSDPRVEIGGDIPPALDDYYTNVENADPIQSFISYFDADTYYFDILAVDAATPRIIHHRGIANGTTAADVQINESIYLLPAGTFQSGTISYVGPDIRMITTNGPISLRPDTHVEVDTPLRLTNASATNDNLVLGSAGSQISEQNSRTTVYGVGSDGSDGIQLRVGDALSVFRNALRASTDAILRADRDQWPTTGSAANVRIFTGDTGSDARIGISTSSRRFKRDIVPATIESSPTISDLRPVWFRDIDAPTDDGPPHLGLVAEDVAETFPALVDLDENGNPFSVDYQKLTVALLGVVQDLQRRIEQLEAQ